MKQITKHDVNKLSVAKLKEMLPFEVVADGEIIFVACDVNKLNPDVHKPRLSPWDLKYGTHKVRCANSLAEKYRTCVR